MVQRLGLAAMAGSTGLIPGGETKICVPSPAKKKKKEGEQITGKLASFLFVSKSLVG